jgi:RIO-like serine/threonine protein kinase
MFKKITILKNEEDSSGDNAMYFQLSEKLGIKIPWEYSEEDLHKELEAYERLSPLLGDLIPECYGIVPVELDGAMTEGLLIEHIPGLTLLAHCKNHVPVKESAIFQTSVYKHIYKRLDIVDAFHADLHANNVMVTPSGEFKLIDLATAG